MTTSPTKRRRLALATLLVAGAAVPAIGQDTPESLLPPGFDDPAPAPAPAPSRRIPAAPIPDVRPSAPASSEVAPAEETADIASAEVTDGAQHVDLTRYELPAFAQHSLARVGVTAAGNDPFAADAFGAADGRWLTTLMRRLDAPIASRWASIALRRALMSPIDTPDNVGGADFAAQRAWVLLRMGEAVAARGLINDVDPGDYTTDLYQVAMQVAMATADPAALCPHADRAAEYVRDRSWALARAMCAGLAGKPNEAGQLFQAARRGTGAGDIDNLLAEKVLGTGAEGRRAVTVEWNGIDRLTSWRWGLATATGVEVPPALYASAGPQVRYWQALAPNLGAAARAPAAELATGAGVFSGAALIDLYSELDRDGEGGATARDLRTAHSASDVADRMQAIESLWNAAETPQQRYARLVLTARAASWIPAGAAIEAPERLIASMLSGGYDRAAMEWRPVVKRGSEAWALITLADPADGTRIAYGDFETFSSGSAPRKAQLLFAGLAGLGRLDAADARRGAEALDVQIGGANAWTRAIDAAGQRGAAGTVALLAGIGMQSPAWEQVTPEALFHVVAAMRASGLSDYARMIAVEAVTRAA